ncbi:N-acetyltransferase [Methyloligella sp. 2.7D]|uniref:GNAT family N-acetyltransferase n=1 Tax=unclassified Methyloligella TaxID=2625955 RepID=UPI00157D0B2B|nr:N-acetyltransferase [Methyloligella sp. GL2]QKP77002.1 N-acetyltransferase [Methyloligella sp. GL2]
MHDKTFEIRSERAADTPALAKLSETAFGPGRFTRTAYRIREGVAPVAALSLTGWIDGALMAGIRFTPVTVGGKNRSLLLGPLVVDPAFANQGFGKALVGEGLAKAKQAGYRLVLLVGDLPYYGRFGFVAVPVGKITLPGPVDPNRLLACELEPGSLAAAQGLVLGEVGASAPLDTSRAQ